MINEKKYNELWEDDEMRRITVHSIKESDLKVGYGHEIPNASDYISREFFNFLTKRCQK